MIWSFVGKEAAFLYGSSLLFASHLICVVQSVQKWSELSVYCMKVATGEKQI